MEETLYMIKIGNNPQLQTFTNITFVEKDDDWSSLDIKRIVKFRL